jgi:hypothetical protein
LCFWWPCRYPKRLLMWNRREWRDPILWVPKDSDYERLSQSPWPLAYFFGFLDLFSWRKTTPNQLVFHDSFLWRKTAKNHLHHLTCSPTSDFDWLATLPSSFESSLPTYVLGVRGIHCPCHLLGKARRRDKQSHMATTASKSQGRWDLLHEEKAPSRTHVGHARTLFFSLHLCNLLHLAYKRESRGPFQGTSCDFLLFTFYFSSREELSLSSSTSSHPWLSKNYRDLGPSSLSRPFVPHTTNQHK